MTNLKDTISNVCGAVIAIGGGILSAVAAGQLVLPATVTTILGAAVAVATGVIGYLTGKPTNVK